MGSLQIFERQIENSAYCLREDFNIITYHFLIIKKLKKILYAFSNQ